MTDELNPAQREAERKRQEQGREIARAAVNAIRDDRIREQGQRVVGGSK